MYQTTDQNHRPPPPVSRNKHATTNFTRKKKTKNKIIKKNIPGAADAQAEDVILAPWTAESLTGFAGKRGEDPFRESSVGKNKELVFPRSGMPAACTLRKKGVAGEGESKREKKKKKQSYS